MPIDPPFNLADVLDGTYPATLTLHLSDMPLGTPFQLGSMHEATFDGYLPAMLQTIQRKPQAEETGLLYAFGRFFNHSTDQNVIARGAWVTCEDPLDPGNPILVAVLPSMQAVLQPGYSQVIVSFQVYELAP